MAAHGSAWQRMAAAGAVPRKRAKKPVLFCAGNKKANVRNEQVQLEK
jgi:hypothetical protein